MTKDFKNALCLDCVPEGHTQGGWWGCRHGFCQRRADHKGPHRSWSREWRDGDQESRLRTDKDRRTT